ncbi:TetR/AcrR family transcriptional regulator [Actinomadura sp. BRA 177]|uniref:TetR/AcrR family transcriptional regulator n=1 Tax=Actinomadura sp. BRA 177 TaxID=2745202 RepID=UPI0015951F69|nr:TetR/AcrR family transcriptional regulator [Actinomadura sp. BRA 177]NVI90181.1 TetR/AcrR family transcriptional regulator [Actinomadura sp. BRA 177]
MANAVSRQQVIDVATRLFSELGYDGTSLRLLADAMGVDPGAIIEIAGDKRELYLEVMSRAFESERTMLERAVSQTEPGRTAVHQIVDAYLDFHLAHPHNRSLWAHRWVDDAADISELEDRYARPLLTLAAHKIRDVVPSDVDPYYLLGTMVWCVHGFLGSGVLERTQGMRRADNPEAVASFRHHLHVLMDKLLAPAPSTAR